jgi:hypothetical protein
MGPSNDIWVPKTNQGLLNMLYGKNSDPDSTKLVTEAINQMLFERAFVRIEKLMLAADLKQLHVGVPLAILRGTFLVREHLMQWEQFRDLVKQELDLRELDSHKMMVGLFS